MTTAMFLANSLQGAKEPDALSFDAVKNFSVTQTAKISNNPVEDGSPVADHYTRDPKTISFSGVVTPWNFADQGSQLTPLQLIQRFDSVMRKGQPFDLFLSEDLQSIRNCLITKFEYNREAKEGESIIVEVEAQQVQLVARAAEADITDLALAPDISEQGQSDVNGGDGVTRATTSLVSRTDSFSTLVKGATR